ncbi:hypothetical protein BJ170DRAFT_683694 [Xylariales sp. AK1849]|nr:hypothetical protein BJ170DRAFT_683694 [Xylariales sp. AK1849]
MLIQQLLSLGILSHIATCADSPAPGQPASTYMDGSFIEPRGNIATYGMGATMNISWESIYNSSNFYLVIGLRYNTPVQLTTNTDSTFFDIQQTSGGFQSAAFHISDNTGEPLSSATTTSALATSTIASASAAVATSWSTSSEEGNDISPTMSTQPAYSTLNPDANTQPGPSSGVKAGVGAGIGIGALGFLALGAGFWFWRRAKTRSTSPTEDQRAYGVSNLPPNHSIDFGSVEASRQGLAFDHAQDTKLGQSIEATKEIGPMQGLYGKAIGPPPQWPYAELHA